MYKTTKTKTTRGEYKEYRKLYVYHGKPNQKWCYLKKEDLRKIPKAIESMQNHTTQTTTQITTQTSMRPNKQNLGFFQNNRLNFESRGWELNPYKAALQAAA